MDLFFLRFDPVKHQQINHIELHLSIYQSNGEAY